MSKLKSFQIDITNLTENITLNSLSDISSVAPTEDQVLSWNSISGNWEARNRTDVAAAWGNIIGTLSNQTDLQSALNLKADQTSLDSHTSDATIHFTEASIDHLNILNIGTNTHAQIDTHIAGTALNHAAQVITFDDTSTNLGAGSPSSINDVQTAIEKIVSNHYYVNVTTGTGSPTGMTDTVLPSGWTTTYNSVGNFTITHSLGNSVVGFALTVLYNGAARVLNPTSITTSAIVFQITDTLNAAVEGNVIGKLLF